MSKRMFIRSLWGDYGEEKHYGVRRRKMDSDINLIQINPYTQPYVAYVFGKENYEYLRSRNIECKLICDEPFFYPCKENGWHQYGHKLKAIQEAMKDYDEVIFLDWDCMANQELPEDFWDKFYEKSDLQAILRGYKLIKVRWRKVDRRKRPCASFIYLRNKQIANDLTKYWEEHPKMSEEDVLAWQTDLMSDGWKDKFYYWDHFEPFCFDLQGEVSYAPFKPSKQAEKTLLFEHYNYKRRDRAIKTWKRK